jgi:putative oligomerization/nucleic acid binding protein
MRGRRGPVRRGPGLLGTAVVAGGAAHMGAKSAQRSQAGAQEEAAQNAQIAELQAQQAAAAPQQAAAAAAPTAPDEPDDAAEIRKYAALKEQGLLTDEEFEAKKKQILGI